MAELSRLAGKFTSPEALTSAWLAAGGENGGWKALGVNILPVQGLVKGFKAATKDTFTMLTEMGLPGPRAQELANTIVGSALQNQMMGMFEGSREPIGDPSRTD